MQLFNISPEEEQWISSTLSQLTLEQKVGQLFCPMMMESDLSAEEQINEYACRLRDEVERFAPGGYYLNRFYLPSTPALLNNIQELSVIPPLICSDMEAGAGGGLGGVIAPDLVPFPPAMGIGATGSEHYAYQVGRCTAWQARSIGVHFVFAPVLDINNNSDNPIINIRSFGEEAELVSRLGSAMIRGLQDGGVIASAKHFPGHGDTSDDSHLLLSTITADRERLQQVELYPYQRAINEAGVYAIMTAHLSVPALEPDKRIPATLSKHILQDVLRDEMGFKGLIVTDALLMGGITSQYEAGEAAVKAFQAGADWLLMPPDLNAAYQAVYQAVQSGDITKEKFSSSLKKILALKAKVQLQEKEKIDLDALRDLTSINSYPYQISCAVCDHAVTLVKNENGLLPLAATESLAVIMLADTSDDYFDEGHLFFREISERTLGEVDFLTLSSTSEERTVHQAHELMQKADVILFGLVVEVRPEKDTVDLPEPFQQLISKAVEQDKPTLVVSFGSPYIVRRIPQVHSFVCGYHYLQPMVCSVAEVVFGERVPMGKLPVSIPGICHRGEGLTF